MSLTGFVARGHIPFGTLVVSFGYGYPGEGAPPEEAEAVIVPGRPPGLRVIGTTYDAPSFVTRVPKDDDENEG